ncbi:hypothetical protein PCC7424_4118 [Gloeothece citriformis PCC 7424]|uniref:Uncharacterized protein n=1 Tax=Gloeothece citriformis (strain PCC 7424) TaxID=65393 RepID=B7KLB7_GLOC7|nr:hypothetical protein [Gloeothece citriformis]ACK72489.1 hypothetical protein PCC7424_4118 [Gloeothece citriformis PCC 7424]
MDIDYFEQHQCTEFCDNRKEIVARDKGEKREYRIINKDSKKFCKVRVDGCLLTEGEKCDYLILNCTDLLAILVELKGSDTLKALGQIDTSITKCQNYLLDFTIYARIVTSKVNTPDLRSTKAISLKKRLKKLNKSEDKSEEYLMIRSQKFEEKF